MRVGARIARTARRLRRDEGGFTLIELMSAMIVTGLGTVALITTLDSSRQLITFNEAKEAAVAVGQRELEKIQSLPYDKIALKDDPVACPGNGGTGPGDVCDEYNPAHYVTGAYYRWDQRPWNEKCSDSGAPAEKCERFVVDRDEDGEGVPPDEAGGVENRRTLVDIPSGSQTDRLKVQIQRFVTWVDDDCTKIDPPPLAPEVCDGVEQDYKRITIAVRIFNATPGTRTQLVNGGPGRPMLFSTTVRDVEE